MPRVTYCRNGHRVSAPESIRLSRPSIREYVLMAERDKAESCGPLQPFCNECGAKTLNACDRCHAAIGTGRRPAYCGACGQPFPWTETALKAAKNYADDLEQLSLQEKETLKTTLDDLTTDSPRTELAAHRFKTFVVKAGPVAGEMLKKIIVEIGTEAAKKWAGL